MDEFIVSARKYRPLTFATVVGQSSIAQTLKNAIQRKQLAHAYLFCGPRGVGKTTCARIFAKTINCLNPKPDGEACGECESCKAFAEGRSYNIHELDAASNNSVEDIRNLIDQVRIPPQIGKFSVYIIDEVHMLSAAAFNAFLKTLEEPPAHAIFILATTEKHKIIPTILSRCQIYDFNRIRVEDIVTYLNEIAKKENRNCEPRALHVIAQKADGSMRDALSIFDQVVSFCGSEVTYTKVIETLNVLDYEYYFKLTNAFLSGDYCTALTIFDEILAKGFDAQHFIRGLSSHFRDLLVCKDTRTTALLEVAASVADDYKRQADACSVNFLFRALDLANACDVGYKSSSNQRLHVELALCKLSSITTERTVEPTVKIRESAPKQTKTETSIKETPSTKIEKTEKIEDEIPKEKIEEGEISAPKKNLTEISKKIEAKEERAETKLDERPKTVSIKGLSDLTSTIKIGKEEESVEIPVEQNEDYTDEQLQAAWTEYADNLKAKRLASAMHATKPLRQAENIIIFKVQHIEQKQALEEKGLAREITQFLQNKLKNTHIELQVQVDENAKIDHSSEPYTDAEKEKYLREKNPELLNFQQKFDLYQ